MRQDDRDARELVGSVRSRLTTGGFASLVHARSDDEWWNVEVEIEAPRDLPMTLTTRNGGIGLEGVSAATRFDSTNGGVSLDRCVGRRAAVAP